MHAHTYTHSTHGHAYTHTHTHMRSTHACTCTAHMLTHAHTRTHTRTHTHAHTHAHTRTHTQAHTHKHTHTSCTHLLHTPLHAPFAHTSCTHLLHRRADSTASMDYSGAFQKCPSRPSTPTSAAVLGKPPSLNIARQLQPPNQPKNASKQVWLCKCTCIRSHASILTSAAVLA